MNSIKTISTWAICVAIAIIPFVTLCGLFSFFPPHGFQEVFIGIVIIVFQLIMSGICISEFLYWMSDQKKILIITRIDSKKKLNYITNICLFISNTYSRCIP